MFGACVPTSCVANSFVRPLQAFAQTLQQSRGFGSEFRFPDQPGGPAAAAAPAAAPAVGGFPAAAAAADDDDDLYN